MWEVTQRKRLEAERQKCEEQLQLIINALPVVISEVDISPGYVFVNKAFENGLSIPYTMVAVRRVRQVVGDDALEFLMDNFFFIILEELAFTVQKAMVMACVF